MGKKSKGDMFQPFKWLHILKGKLKPGIQFPTIMKWEIKYLNHSIECD